MDELICSLSTSNSGHGYYSGCIMYADDLLPLSRSLCGLKSMLDLCCTYAQCRDLVFNAKNYMECSNW